MRRSAEISVGKAPGSASPAESVEHSTLTADPPFVEGHALTVWFAFDGLALAAGAALAAARARLG